jgi:plasmid maintenance system killer protein
MRSLNLEKLEGDRAGERSLRLSDQWRMIDRLEAT